MKKSLYLLVGFCFLVIAYSPAVSDTKADEQAYRENAKSINEIRSKSENVKQQQVTFPGTHPSDAISDTWSWFTDAFNVYVWRESGYVWIEIEPLSGYPFICSGSFVIILGGIQYDTVRLENVSGSSQCGDVYVSSIFWFTQWSFYDNPADLNQAFTILYDGGENTYTLDIAADPVPNRLWQYDGTSWAQISTSDPDNTGNTMVAYNNGLAVDFGSLGLYYYNGTSWNQLSTNNPEWLTAYNGNLAADFGTYGLWQYDGTSWAQISTSNPDNTDNTMVAYNNGLAVDFASLGLYYYNGTSWNQLSTNNPEWLTTYNGNLAADFGATYGLYSYNGSAWSQISTGNPDNTGNTMVAYNNGLAVDFGSLGLYYYNGTSWSQLSTNNPEWLAAYNGNLAADEV